MPDADKHRHYRILAPSLLALLLACLIVTIGAIATSNLPAHGRIDLEHNAQLNSFVLHGSRQELRNNPLQNGPAVDAADGPEYVASTLREATNLVPGLKRAVAVRLANVYLPPLRDRVLSSRAPPANFTLPVGV